MFVSTIQTAYYEGVLNEYEVCKKLNIKPEKLEEVYLMKVIIDTSSLLSLVRYYLPFDKKTKLFDFIKTEFENGNLILIDAVYQECEYTSNGIVLKSLDYFLEKKFKKDNKLPIKTKDLIPPSTKKFYNLLNDNFRTPLSRRLNEAEFEERKKSFLKLLTLE